MAFGLGPAPSAPVRTPRLDRTPQQTDAPACPSGSFSLPHVLRELRLDADPAARDSRWLRSWTEVHNAPGVSRGAGEDAAAQNNCLCPPGGVRPRRLPLQLSAHDLSPRAGRERWAGGCEGVNIWMSYPHHINRSAHWSVPPDVTGPPCLFHVIAKVFLNERGREAGRERVRAG